MSVVLVLYIALHMEEDRLVHLKARSAVLRLMGPNEKELAVGAIRLE